MPNFARNYPSREALCFGLSVMGRMIFSCLVDADFKDTETFYAALEGRVVERDWPTLDALLPVFREAFDTHMRDEASTGTTVNRLRGDILAHVRGKAGEAPGLFTLTVPTGGGKTLASLGFALDHAQAHGHRRIIYAIPFTSIIDQTVDVFRDILGDEHVLAHHSAVEEQTFDPKQRRDSRVAAPLPPVPPQPMALMPRCWPRAAAPSGRHHLVEPAHQQVVGVQRPAATAGAPTLASTAAAAPAPAPAVAPAPAARHGARVLLLVVLLVPVLVLAAATARTQFLFRRVGFVTSAAGAAAALRPFLGVSLLSICHAICRAVAAITASPKLLILICVAIPTTNIFIHICSV